jgi:hypothetical protein
LPVRPCSPLSRSLFSTPCPSALTGCSACNQTVLQPPLKRPRFAGLFFARCKRGQKKTNKHVDDPSKHGRGRGILAGQYVWCPCFFWASFLFSWKKYGACDGRRF